MDDPGIGQHQLDHADHQEIAGQLVGDEARLGREFAQQGNVGLAHLAQSRIVDLVERRRDRKSRTAGERAHQLIDEAELAAALHRRMARQDLLDQARTGARHPQHEDRGWIGRATRRMGGKALGREGGLDGIEQPVCFRAGIAEVRPLELVALEEEVKGFAIGPEVFEGLAEPEAHLHPIVFGRAVVAIDPLHRRDIRVARAVGDQVRQRAVPGAAIGFEGDGPPEAGLRVLKPSVMHLRHAEVMKQYGDRLQPYRPPQAGHRFVNPAKRIERPCPEAQRLDHVGPDGQDLLCLGQGLERPTEPQQGTRQPHANVDDLGATAEHRFVIAECLDIARRPHQQIAQIEHGLKVRGVERKRGTIGGLRIGPESPDLQRTGEIAKHGRIARVEHGSAPQPGYRHLASPAIERHDAAEVEGARMLRLEH